MQSPSLTTASQRLPAADMADHYAICHEARAIDFRIACAGWTVPKKHASAFPATGSHLQRYAGRFRGVEINSSFYRPHRPATYARWASSVSDDFMFAVKMPKEITHTHRLAHSSDALTRFLAEIEGLGAKLGPVLVQLPPSLSFDFEVTETFFKLLRKQHSGPVVCEPRHRSWFTLAVARLMQDYRIARVAADPAVIFAAAQPAGWHRHLYYRLHGSPHMYYSSYSDSYLDWLKEQWLRNGDVEAIWCVFDNTALGAATVNAFQLVDRLRQAGCSCMSAGSHFANT